MAQEGDSGVTLVEFNEWVIRIFGSEDAHRLACPERRWEPTANGWASRERFGDYLPNYLDDGQ
jgi:hypothetical protein